MGQYTGHALVSRLIFVAKKAAEKQDESLELDALKIAVDEARKAEQTALYTEVTQRINGRCGQDYVCDAAWIERVDRRTAQKQDKLESELNGYKVRILYFLLFCFLRCWTRPQVTYCEPLIYFFFLSSSDSYSEKKKKRVGKLDKGINQNGTHFPW